MDLKQAYYQLSIGSKVRMIIWEPYMHIHIVDNTLVDEWGDKCAMYGYNPESDWELYKELNVWVWALWQMEEGRTVKWHDWHQGEYLYLGQREENTNKLLYRNNHGVGHIKWELKHFREKGWMHYYKHG